MKTEERVNRAKCAGLSMPSLASSLGVVADHIWLGVVAALLFVAGLATAGPVVQRDHRWLTALPLAVVRLVLRLIGPGFRALPAFLVIFTFNATAICLYMLSGALIVLPGAMAFLTGLNIGVVTLKAGEIEVPGGQGTLGALVAAGERREVPRWANYCGLLVLALELPSFWVSVGMGIGMARKLSAAGAYTLANLNVLAAERLHAYWMVIVPALLLSALAETAAIRGHIGARGSGARPPEDAAPG